MNHENNEEEEIANAAKRREIRTRQRELQVDCADIKAQLNSVGSTKFQTVRGRLNDIFEKVSHPREQQNDAITFRELSMAAKQQSANMSDSAHKFDYTFLAQNIKDKHQEGREFSWEKFGLALGPICTSVPMFETMLGPLSKEVKVRKLAVRHTREDRDLTAEKPEEIVQDEEDADEATNERQKLLYEMIIRKTLEDEEQTAAMDLLTLLVDPADNVQTIENFFDFSFLIKNKSVMQDLDVETGLPVTVGCDTNKLYETDGANDKRQMILSINMQDLSEFAKLLYPDFDKNSNNSSSASLTPLSGSSGHSGHPLHREDPLYQAADAHEQADLIAQKAKQRAAERQASKKQKSAAAGGDTNGTRNTGKNKKSAAAPSSESFFSSARQQQSSSSSSSGNVAGRAANKSVSPSLDMSPAAARFVSATAASAARLNASDGESPVSSTNVSRQENVTPQRSNRPTSGSLGTSGSNKRQGQDVSVIKNGRADEVTDKRQKL